MGPNFPFKMPWERLILLSLSEKPAKNNFLPQEVPATGDWTGAPWLQQHSISTFFLGHPVLPKKGAPTTKAFCSDKAFSLTYINIEALVSLCVFMKGWHNLLDIPILNYQVRYSTYITKECSYAYSWADENLQILSSNTVFLVEISTRITEFSPRNL